MKQDDHCPELMSDSFVLLSHPYQRYSKYIATLVYVTTYIYPVAN